MRQAIETKFIGPTNFRGPRVKATAQAGSVTISWNDALGVDDNHVRAASALAVKYGWDAWDGRWIVGARADGKGNVYVNDCDQKAANARSLCDAVGPGR